MVDTLLASTTPLKMKPIEFPIDLLTAISVITASGAVILAVAPAINACKPLVQRFIKTPSHRHAVSDRAPPRRDPARQKVLASG